MVVLKDKQLFRCKRGCPQALFCQLTKNGFTAYESTCEHKHKQSNYFLPKKAIEVVDDCFDKNQNKPSEIFFDPPLKYF